MFRVIAICLATFLLRWTFAKLLGGVYLVYIAIRHFFPKRDKNANRPPTEPAKPPQDGPPGSTPATASASSYFFWSTVAIIELTDIAFAIDSILAAIALVTGSRIETGHPHPKLWVIMTGGMLGVVMMRFAAIVFIRLLDRFPRFETSAYLLILIIGAKLLFDWALNTPDHPHTLNFHDFHRMEFWSLWLLMLLCLLIGFIPLRRPAENR